MHVFLTSSFIGPRRPNPTCVLSKLFSRMICGPFILLLIMRSNQPSPRRHNPKKKGTPTTDVDELMPLDVPPKEIRNWESSTPWLANRFGCGSVRAYLKHAQISRNTIDEKSS